MARAEVSLRDDVVRPPSWVDGRAVVVRLHRVAPSLRLAASLPRRVALAQQVREALTEGRSSVRLELVLQPRVEVAGPQLAECHVRAEVRRLGCLWLALGRLLLMLLGVCLLCLLGF